MTSLRISLLLLEYPEFYPRYLKMPATAGLGMPASSLALEFLSHKGEESINL